MKKKYFKTLAPGRLGPHTLTPTGASTTRCRSNSLRAWQSMVILEIKATKSFTFQRKNFDETGYFWFKSILY
jgi:hypothetical protein